ncbi:23S rRNA (uracil(1939)-C(5))-methyltransferase RlmD [Treponema phagedenis]|uniref:23S rRNA (uracil(1939)-C(5))-methyltransferase RlmD n=1 Tax=Treponema phagedenis TaxID=162 RepID=UPI0001F6404A|nr:23S rRNA (uracil(1939)-C(5))-methyltransferase RlmD [Treponema phagedenis]EFW39415.1 23S rRNA (uracil-5-)-methyltransferase RumA [Treponema phagedenis F0421]QSH99256.1 23S rRNA (uracil(1939)-C(5))-methyltransferase RlmD [Treponema phagedenis]TYT76489.1 23S rRNA (uracil(1939)-C(5))-methyltransferase RlmD [Treponema phagedenis]TYT76768.1 23S rRNA (uracil(1939)-C(5))-methyltransferase RlmD [Treponema phagedenis]
MTIKDILDLVIIDSNITGDGIAKLDSFVIIVPYALKGDIVKCEIKEIGKSFARAEIITIIKPSKDRVEPKCKLFKVCGGCSLLHQEYQSQLKVKKQFVENNFKKIARTEVQVENIYSANPFYYRNKVQLPIGLSSDGKIIAGYYKINTHEVVAQDDCYLANPQFKKIIAVFLKFANTEKLSVYNKSNSKGLLRHLIIRKIGDTPFLTIVINGSEVPNLHKLNAMYNAENIFISIGISSNTKHSSLILNNKVINKFGKAIELADILGTKIRASQNSFMQVNSEVRDLLYKDAINIIEEIKTDTIIEGYSGIGIMTNVFAKQFKKVYAIEIDPEAVEDAEYNRKLNNNNNIKNICGDAAKEISKIINAVKENYALVFDPPRKGLDKKIIDAIKKSKPKTIFYISCDSATLARDYSYLKDLYTIEKLLCYDMFPQTSHVETVALLSKLDVDKHIDVEIELDELDLTSAESKATYAQIKEYVWNKFELKVSTLYIAQIKRKCGIELREHYNKSKKEKQIIPQCTPEKEEAIMGALRHFKMI